MANDLIFHAAALTSAFLTYKEDKRFVKKSPELFKDLATQVILSTLSTPHTYHRDILFRFVESEENFYENEKQLASYLYLTTVPTRYSLLDDIKRFSILDYVPVETKKLFEIMLLTPLRNLDQNAFIESLDKIEENKNHAVYIPYLKNSFAIELIVKLSSFYDCMSFNKLQQSIPFLSQGELETCLISIFKYLHCHIKIDHNTSSIHFPSSISFPVTSQYSDNNEFSDDKLSQLKRIHSLFSQTILNTKRNEMIQAYQTLKNHSKDSFIGIEKNLFKIFSKRRMDLETLQNKQDKRKRILPLQIKREAPVVNVPTPVVEVPVEKPPENVEKVVKEPIIETRPKEEHREMKSLIEKIEVKSKVEEKPKDPNRLKQHEKSLDCLFRAQREKELKTLKTQQLDRTIELNEKWNTAEKSRVEAARDLFAVKIDLRNIVQDMSDDIFEFKDTVIENRSKQLSDDSNMLTNLYDETEGQFLAERKKIQKLKRMQTYQKYQQKQTSHPKPKQNVAKESPRYQPPPRESRDRNFLPDNVHPTQEAASNVYVPPHRKRQIEGNN